MDLELQQAKQKWLGKSVRQFDGIRSLIGRTGKVEEIFFDEKGNLHCKVVGTNDDWFWCPASLLVLEVSS